MTKEMQTLLLADDSVTIQRVIELTFADENINVVAVSDGDQAIARLDSMPPDIVLVDVGMPGKSGYDVAGYVKHTPHLAHIPVVLLTGAFEPVDEAKANALGCDGVLAKPFEPQIVISRVKELLSRQPADRVERVAAVESPVPAPEATPGPAPAQTSEPVPVETSEPAPVETSAAAPAETAAAAPVETSAFVPPAAEPANNGDAAKLDEYFDQLDSAFARFTNGPVPATFDSSLSLQSAPLPSGLRLPDSAELVRQVEALEPPTNDPVARRESIASVEPLVAVPSVPRELPPLADAFAAILAAEQSGPAASAAWPTAAPAAASPVITDEVIDRVSRRVIEQMTDRIVREAVADAVSGIAERLVREEIERIKKTIEGLSNRGIE